MVAAGDHVFEVKLGGAVIRCADQLVIGRVGALRSSHVLGFDLVVGVEAVDCTYVATYIN